MKIPTSSINTDQIIKDNQARLELTLKKLKFNSKEYWEQRCRMREKMEDPTYSQTARDFCFRMWMMLVNKN